MNPDDPGIRVALGNVDAIGSTLIGRLTYDNHTIHNQAPMAVVIKGHKNWQGQFLPDARLEVADEARKWRTIGKSRSLVFRNQVTISPGERNFDLIVNLNPFKPMLGKYKWGRIVLSTGDAASFSLSDLALKEHEIH
jgi:hypothetical protein